MTGFYACTESEAKPEEAADEKMEMTEEEMVERGQYLVGILDCNVCHTPKVMTDQGPGFDTERLLSGHPGDRPIEAGTVPMEPEAWQTGQWIVAAGDFTAYAGAWGISFAANLTPHETGLANWTVENFKRSIKHGEFKGMEGGRKLLPPMPWQAYSALPDEDLEAIWAYLQTIPAVDNRVPNPVPPAGPPPSEPAS